MLLPDVNLLVYAFREDVAEHERANHWLTTALEGPATLAVTTAALTGFIRIVTHPRIFSPPSRIEQALEFVELLWDVDLALPVEPGSRYSGIFIELCSITQAIGNAVPDAHLAAIAIENGAELVSHDRGFARFPGLRWTDPLA